MVRTVQVDIYFQDLETQIENKKSILDLPYLLLY